MDSEQTNLTLQQALGVLRRRAPWVLLCVVLAGGAAFAYSKHQTKQYTATASLLFNNSQLSQQLAGLPVTTSTNQQATNVKLVQLGDMSEKTASLLFKRTGARVSGAVSVSAEGESSIVDVSATSSSPLLAADIANTYTKIFVKEQQSANHAAYVSALALVDKQLAALPRKERNATAGLALQERAQSLGTLAELRSGDVQVAQAAGVPTVPTSPRVARSTILGAVLGLLLGLGIAFLLEHFDRRIREPKDLEAVYGLPILGIVPRSRAIARSSRGKQGAPAALPRDEAEAFQLIRAHLRYFNVDRELRTLLITSAAPGDGKTTIARHLAGAAASVGSAVLLLEADLRRPTMARQLGVASGPGLSDVLIGSVSLWRATQLIELDAPSENNGQPRMLDVLVAGRSVPPNPSELIESQAMEALLEQAKETYDLIVIDSSPLAAVSTRSRCCARSTASSS